VFAHAGKRYLFFEDYARAEQRGVIACSEILPSGEIGIPVPCLDTGSHLSYPMVFQHDGEVFMIPESARTRAVVLYRAARFPELWVEEKVLFDKCRAVDTTVHHQDGKWWFFTTASDRVAAPKLLLFYSNSLTGTWTYHPANPISSDIRNARGAGALLRRGERLLRPSQSGSPRYGHSFALNEIVELSTRRYREVPLKTIRPSWASGMVATHTYGYGEGVEVTDGCFWSRRR
jgi:hypothetical protein